MWASLFPQPPFVCSGYISSRSMCDTQKVSEAVQVGVLNLRSEKIKPTGTT